MENIFVVKKFEDGWEMRDLADIDTQEMYCLESLEIPDEKIYGTEIVNNGLEIILTDLSRNELHEDWYVNLNRLCA